MSEKSKLALELLDKVVASKPGGERREQQVQMIQAMCKSVESKDRLMVEAGTGSGKSFSELIPASVYANPNSRWVISTATNQLSDQIGRHDLPFLETVIPSLKGRWCVVKGRANYLCLDRVAQVERDAQAEKDALIDISSSSKNGHKEGEEVSAVLEWAKSEGCSGDRADAPPVSDKVWDQFSRTSQTCPGARVCPFARECFAEKALGTAIDCDIVVTNHAMSAIQLASDKGTLGDMSNGVYVFDESHELESYLSSAWGGELSESTVKRWDKQLKDCLGQSNADLRKKFTQALDKALSSALVVCGKEKSNIAVPLGESFPDAVSTHLSRAWEHGVRLSKIVLHDEKNKAILRKWSDEALSLLGSLTQASEDTVFWLDYDSGEWMKTPKPSVKIMCAPLMVGGMLKSYAENQKANTIFTSATIRVDGGFSVPNQKLGGGDVKSITLGSPFTYGKQGILCIPDVPEPSCSYEQRQEHFDQFKEMSLDMCQALGGATLILCTSKVNARKMAEFLEEEGVDVVDTVRTPQAQASEKFKKNRHVVMVGTYGVWQGLDVQGESLQAVLIEKIPFNRIDDVLANARKQYWDQNGENGFMLEPIASAQNRLNQAVGRLIRHKEDRGIVAIFDPRMKTKNYGRILLNGLPSFYRNDDWDSVIESAKRLSARSQG